MSESKSETTPAVTAGNLRNRIDNNLKLSIPNTSLSFNNMRNHPSTAPAVSGLKELKNLMKNWDHDMSELGEDDYFVTTPGSIVETPSSLKRKNFSPLSIVQRSRLFITEQSPLVSQFMDKAKMSPILQVSEASSFFIWTSGILLTSLKIWLQPKRRLK